MTELEIVKEALRKDPDFYGTVASIGIVQHTTNKSSLTQVNKILNLLQFEKVDKETYLAILNDIVEENAVDETFMVVFNQFVSGHLGLTDLIAIFLPKEVESEKKPTVNLEKVISPYAVAHQKVLADNREFNKIQREGAWVQLLIDGLRDELKKELKEGLNIRVYSPHMSEANRPKRALIVNLGDLHIGALVVNKNTGGYNYEILQQRLKTYLDGIQTMVKMTNPTEIIVNGLGDYIEHINMRNVNQAFEAEFPATEQIAKATRTLIEFICALDTMTNVPIRLYMIAGNHDRFVGNKGDAIYNDSVAYVILDTLLLMKDHSDLLNNISIHDNREDVYNAQYEVLGKQIVLDHGTNLKGFGSNINKFIKDKPIDLLITGHIHHVVQMQEDYARFQVVNSSPMGANNYSKDLKLPATSPSQTVLLLGDDIKGIITYPIFL